MSIADFANRKYDFLALQRSDDSRNSRLDLVLYSDDNPGKICAGPQKLAQRWLLEFLTEKGSLIGLPDRGCDFMRFVRQGTIKTQLNVTQTFNASNMRIRVTLQDEEYAGMPDDERLDDAELLSVGLLPGYMNLSIGITSRAGDAREILVPIATLP
jgi:hypothetical protein